MQQRINIKILFYFTSHKQRKNYKKLLQKFVSQFDSIVNKGMGNLLQMTQKMPMFKKP